MTRWFALLALVPALAFADGDSSNAHNPSGGNQPELAHPPPTEVPPSEMDREDPNSTRNQEEHAMGEVAQGAGDTMIDWGQYGAGAVKNLEELQASYKALSDFDQHCVDVSALDGSPAVPASCAEQKGPCGTCYSEAVRKLEGTRLALEKLHCFYAANKRFIDAAISLGDNTSGIHAVSGIEWQHERAGIMKELDKFNSDYDTTLQKTLAFLKKDLDGLGECEMKFFSNADWYARFGYLYYGFMSDRYKR